MRELLGAGSSRMAQRGGSGGRSSSGVSLGRPPGGERAQGWLLGPHPTAGAPAADRAL